MSSNETGARIIDGKAIAQEFRREVRAASDRLVARGLRRPGLAVILVGDERDLGRSVRGGGSGSICGVANVFPQILGPVAREGKEDARVRPIVDAICRQPVLPAIKALIAHHKKDAEWARMRPPLADLDSAGTTKLVAEVDAAAKQSA